MIVRKEVFDTYWKFAAKRQEVFFNRIKDLLPPWTDDEILNTYKFTNTYRASDRVSQYLIRNVIYKGSQIEEEVIFRVLLFKIFNKIETWQYLEGKLGSIEFSKFDFDLYSKLLHEAMTSGQAIYTSAYMSCATKAFGYEKKHENHLALIQRMTQKDNITGKIVNSHSLEDLFLLLASYPLIGKFMAYQLAIDINYSEVVNFDENSFTVAGPGAERGIRKCFLDTGGKSNDYIIHWMTDNQDREFERLGLPFESLWGRPLYCIDCQGLFCETDKYSRVAFPELRSNRKRIKAKFQPNTQKIDYFFPRKWGINDKVAAFLKQQETKAPNQDSTFQQMSLGL